MTQEKLIRFFLNEKDYLKTLIDPLIETKNSLIKNESEVFHEITLAELAKCEGAQRDCLDLAHI